MRSEDGFMGVYHTAVHTVREAPISDDLLCQISDPFHTWSGTSPSQRQKLERSSAQAER